MAVFFLKKMNFRRQYFYENGKKTIKTVLQHYDDYSSSTIQSKC